jgi:hypothetical protein
MSKVEEKSNAIGYLNHILFKRVTKRRMMLFMSMG